MYIHVYVCVFVCIYIYLYVCMCAYPYIEHGFWVRDVDKKKMDWVEWKVAFFDINE